MTINQCIYLNIRIEQVRERQPKQREQSTQYGQPIHSSTSIDGILDTWDTTSVLRSSRSYFDNKEGQ